MKNIRIKAILLGLLALIIIDGIGGILLTLALTGEVSGETVKNIQSDTLFLILRMFVGALALVGAGFIVEKLAKSTGLINSGILGVISVALTILALNDAYPIWYLILSYLYQLPSALAGGFIVNRRFIDQNKVISTP